MTASAFVIVAIEGGGYVAGAVVAPDARYCSIYWLGQGGIERRFVPAGSWKALENECRTMQSGPVSSDSTLVRSLLGEKAASYFVQHLHTTPVTVESPAAVASQLDKLLRSLVPSRLSLRQERGED